MNVFLTTFATFCRRISITFVKWVDFWRCLPIVSYFRFFHCVLFLKYVHVIREERIRCPCDLWPLAIICEKIIFVHHLSFNNKFVTEWFFGGKKLNFYTINSSKISLYAALQGQFLYVLKLVYSHFNSIEMIIYLLKNVNSINSKDVFECSFGRET